MKSATAWVRHYAFPLFYIVFILIAAFAWYAWDAHANAQRDEVAKDALVVACQRENDLRRSVNKFHRQMKGFIIKLRDASETQRPSNPFIPLYDDLIGSISTVAIPNCERRVEFDWERRHK